MESLLSLGSLTASQRQQEIDDPKLVYYLNILKN